MRACELCEEPISEKRLAVIPTATHCVKCLEKMGDVAPIREDAPDLNRFGIMGDSGETWGVIRSCDGTRIIRSGRGQNSF